ncbi:MAG: TCR/Tet family MFS transporter [Alphaproteobacteria bacterium]|nr:TCR/Tet family MFS transporter [Alphaproteobacteria bacterium]MBT4965181.1 TCR/Tet family MFS transporter [Alphaproteobacteria bacterium]MBT5159666.1 TCR/Tet family MFS transporter [Alphaproteobacteria bacterium]MBT6384560.1 TCR/Tet family MFS transporter [Alphaproteobacteria bacterium]
MLDSMGIGLIMPVMPDLLIDLGGTDLSTAATWGGALAATFSVMQFLCGPTVGSVSDRFGRRPVLLISLMVMSTNYMVMGFAQSVWVMAAARIGAGIASATQSTANAYMADISKPDQKAQNFGLMGAAFGVGFIMGPVAGGFLGELGPRAPFFAAAILGAVNALFGFVVLSETVTDAIRRPFQWRRANPFGAFRYVGRLPGVTRLLIVFFFYNIAFFVYPSVWAYYTQESFGWDATMVGVSLGVFGFSMVVVQGGLIRIIVPRFGEHKTVILGYSITILAFTIYALAWEGWQVFALAPLTALGIIGGPALQGIMSRVANKDQQGELQGVLTSVGAVGAIFSPLIMTNVFGFFTGEDAPIYFPGAPFVFAMALVFIALVIFMGRTRLHDR